MSYLWLEEVNSIKEMKSILIPLTNCKIKRQLLGCRSRKLKLRL